MSPIMPRKNQKRKNANSQSGRRKAKPIKFNRSDIENEQKLLRASIGDAAVDEHPNELEHNQDEEMESSNGSTSHQEQDDDDDDDNSIVGGIDGNIIGTTTTTTANNQIILNLDSNGNEIDRANQTDETDDVQNDATIRIPVAYNDSLANSTFNCNFSCRNCFFLLSPSHFD